MQTTSAAGEADGNGLAPEPELGCTRLCEQGTNQEGGVEAGGTEARVTVGGPLSSGPEPPSGLGAAQGRAVDEPAGSSTGHGLCATYDRNANTGPGLLGTTSGSNSAVGAPVVETSEGVNKAANPCRKGGNQSTEALCAVGNDEETCYGPGHNVQDDARADSAIHSMGSQPSQSDGQGATPSSGPPAAAAAPEGASKEPPNSASLDPHASKVAATARVTRQGRWAYRNQTKCRFCGGKLCLRCSEQCALRCKGAAIHGLHSHWITDSIIGMQRPSSRLLQAYDIVGQFKRKGVTAIFNLTEPGEHPHCGDGLEKMSGFPYLPETLMREGISVYNFAWEDMTTPSMQLLTDIVRVAVSCIRAGGKIAVHCHAGYGRTGLVIASVLVMTKNLPAQQAVALVRDKRPTSVQTNAQVSIVSKFADFVRGVRVVYHLTDHARVTLGQHLAQQAFLLHGQESVTLRWLPKPVALATRMLVALAREKPEAVVLALAGVEDGGRSDNCERFCTNEGFSVWGMAEEQHLKAMQYASNSNDWEPWDQLAEACDARPASVDPRIPAQLLYDWLAQLAAPPITVTELRRVLPQSAIAAVVPDEDREAAVPSAIQNGLDVPPEGQFYRLNLLPVGQVRLLESLTGCLRSVRDALETANLSQGNMYQKACLRVAISMVHLSTVHEGLLLGRNIAHDAIQVISSPSRSLSARKQAPSQPQPQLQPHARRQEERLGGRGPSLAGDIRLCTKAMEVLIQEWNAPLRCRPYGKLEALNNQPDVHGGSEEYWHQKRRSVVPPKDLIDRDKVGDGKGGQSEEHEHTSTTMQYTPGHTMSLCTVNSADTFSSWGAQDDTGLARTLQDKSSSAVRRRSLSSGNIKQGLDNVAPFDVIRPLIEDTHLITGTTQ